MKLKINEQPCVKPVPGFLIILESYDHLCEAMEYTQANGLDEQTIMLLLQALNDFKRPDDGTRLDKEWFKNYPEIASLDRLWSIYHAGITSRRLFSWEVYYADDKGYQYAVEIEDDEQ